MPETSNPTKKPLKLWIIVLLTALALFFIPSLGAIGLTMLHSSLAPEQSNNWGMGGIVIALGYGILTIIILVLLLPLIFAYINKEPKKYFSYLGKVLLVAFVYFVILGVVISAQNASFYNSNVVPILNARSESDQLAKNTKVTIKDVQTFNSKSSDNKDIIRFVYTVSFNQTSKIHLFINSYFQTTTNPVYKTVLNSSEVKVFLNDKDVSGPVLSTIIDIEKDKDYKLELQITDLSKYTVPGQVGKVLAFFTFGIPLKGIDESSPSEISNIEDLTGKKVSFQEKPGGYTYENMYESQIITID